jgi:nuclease-like protein
MPSTLSRQQWQRLGTATTRAAWAVLALLLAVTAAREGRAVLASALGVVAVALALASRRSLRLAARSRVGAASEALVRTALASLEREGWRVRHSLDWPGRGDLDHVVRAPSGMGFMIETKTARYTRAHPHLVRAGDAAWWLGRRHWHYPSGVRPVICLARGRRVERFDDDVLVVSLDRLVSALYREAARRSGRFPRISAMS